MGRLDSARILWAATSNRIVPNKELRRINVEFSFYVGCGRAVDSSIRAPEDALAVDFQLRGKFGFYFNHRVLQVSSYTLMRQTRDCGGMYTLRA